MILRFLFVLVLSGLVALGADARPMDAKEAVGTMRKAIALVGKEAKAAKLDPKSRRDQAFLSAIKKADTSARAAEKSVAAKDPSAFEAIDNAASAGVEVEAAWKISDVLNPKIDAAVKTLTDASDVARNNFGRAASRKNQGGQLDAKEKAELAKARAEAEALRKTLAELRGTSPNKAINADLERTDKQLAGALAVGATVGGLLDVLWWLDVSNRRWNAWNGWGARNDPRGYPRWRTYTPRFRSGANTARNARNSWPASNPSALVVPVEVAAPVADIPITDAELADFDRDADAMNVDDPADLRDTDADGTPDVADQDADRDATPDAQGNDGANDANANAPDAATDNGGANDAAPDNAPADDGRADGAPADNGAADDGGAGDGGDDGGADAGGGGDDGGGDDGGGGDE